jgi:hypothetical protein
MKSVRDGHAYKTSKGVTAHYHSRMLEATRRYER